MIAKLVNRCPGAGLTAIAFLCIASRCGAADANCVRFTGQGAGESIRLERGYVLSGALPVLLCGIERDVSYRMTLGGPGMERRIGRFTLEEDGVAVGGIRIGAAARNAAAPGWGSAHAERPGATAADLVSLVGGLAVLANEQQEYSHLENRLDILQAAAVEAETYDEKTRAASAEHDAARMLNIQNAHRRRLVALCGALYGWQVIEPFFTDAPPASSAGSDGASLALRGAGRSRAKAFVYSLIRPGRGQFYQGKTLRGLLFSGASVAAGLLALEYQNRFDEAVGAYDLCVERFDAAGSIPEKEAFASRCAVLRDDADSAESSRNIVFIALAAVWGINCVDALFDSSGGEASPIAFEIDGRKAAIAVRF